MKATLKHDYTATDGQQLGATQHVLNPYTVYVSGNYVVKFYEESGDASKHYYMGAQRVATNFGYLRTAYFAIFLATFIFLSVKVKAQNEYFTIKFIEDTYKFYEEDFRRQDTLIFNILWDFRGYEISEADSMRIYNNLILICNDGEINIDVLYWDYELTSYSSWIYKKRGQRILHLIESFGFIKSAGITLRFCIVEPNEITVQPYDNPRRTIMILKK